MKRPSATRHHLRPLDGPPGASATRRPCPEAECSATALPYVERLMRGARKQRFKPVTEFHPLEGDILVAVVCRYCHQPFEP